MDLALHDHGIDDGADIIDGPVTHDLDTASLRIDLDLTDMRAVAERKARRIVGGLLRKPRLGGLERKVVRDIGCPCDCRERRAPVGAGYDKAAVGEIDVAESRLEQMGCDQLALGNDLLGRTMERAA